MRLEYFMREQTFDNQAVVRIPSLMTSQGELICWTDRKWIYEGSLLIGIHRYFWFFFSSELFIQAKERGREQCENTTQYRHIKMFLGDLLGIILHLMSWNLGPLLSNGRFQRFIRWLWSSATSQGDVTRVKTVKVRTELVKSCVCVPSFFTGHPAAEFIYKILSVKFYMKLPGHDNTFLICLWCCSIFLHIPLLVSCYEVWRFGSSCSFSFLTYLFRLFSTAELAWRGLLPNFWAEQSSIWKGALGLLSFHLISCPVCARGCQLSQIYWLNCPCSGQLFSPFHSNYFLFPRVCSGTEDFCFTRLRKAICHSTVLPSVSLARWHKHCRRKPH